MLTISFYDLYIIFFLFFSLFSQSVWLLLALNQMLTPSHFTAVANDAMQQTLSRGYTVELTRNK